MSKLLNESNKEIPLLKQQKKRKSYLQKKWPLKHVNKWQIFVIPVRIFFTIIKRSDH